MVCSLVSITVDSPQLSKKLNKVHKTLDFWLRDIAKFWFFRKGPGYSFFTTICVWFLKKNVSMLYTLLTDQI